VPSKDVHLFDFLAIRYIYFKARVEDIKTIMYNVLIKTRFLIAVYSIFYVLLFMMYCLLYNIQRERFGIDRMLSSSPAVSACLYIIYISICI